MLVRADEHPAGIISEDVAIVSHYHYRRTERFVQFAEEFHDAVRSLGVQIAGGFVGQNDLGPVEDGAGDRDSLLLASGKLVGHFVAFSLHSHLRERFFYAFFGGGALLPAGRGKDELKVVVDVSVRQEHEVLEHHAALSAEHGDVSCADVVHSESADVACAFLKGIVGYEGFDDGGFPGTDSAHYVDEIAGVDVHVHIVQDSLFSAFYMRIPESDQGFLFLGHQKMKFL